MRRTVRLALALLVACGCSPSRTDGPITLFGNVEMRDARLAFVEQELVAPVEGEEGDRVAAGQVLARLRTERLAAELSEANARRAAQAQAVLRLENGARPEEVEQARARVVAAEAQVLRARQDFERIEPTVASGASSAQNLANARAALDVAEAQLRVEREALALALARPRAHNLA